MSKPILEIKQPQFRVIGEAKEKGKTTLRVEAVWGRYDIINANKRLYPKSVMKKAIEELQPALKEGKVSGMAFHPKDAFGETPDVTHVWESVEMKDNGVCTGTFKVIPTSKGKDIIEMLKAGLSIPMSSRGVGTWTTKKKKVDGQVVEYNEINDDFRLISPADFVMSASAPGARTIRVIEGKNVNEYLLTESDESVLKEAYEKDDKKKVTKKEFDKQVEIGLQAAFMIDEKAKPEDWPQFKEENREKMIEIVKKGLASRGFDLTEAFEHEKIEKLDKALREQNRDEQLYQDAKRAGYRGTLKEWKAKIKSSVSLKE